MIHVEEPDDLYSAVVLCVRRKMGLSMIWRVLTRFSNSIVYDSKEFVSFGSCDEQCCSDLYVEHSSL